MLCYPLTIPVVSKVPRMGARYLTRRPAAFGLPGDYEIAPIRHVDPWHGVPNAQLVARQPPHPEIGEPTELTGASPLPP